MAISLLILDKTNRSYVSADLNSIINELLLQSYRYFSQEIMNIVLTSISHELYFSVFFSVTSWKYLSFLGILRVTYNVLVFRILRIFPGILAGFLEFTISWNFLNISWSRNFLKISLKFLNFRFL